MFNSKTLARVIFAFLLLAMLKHTAWTFDIFESSTLMIWGISAEAWLLATAFESSIYVFSEKLSKRLENTPRVRGNFRALKKLSYRYANSFTVALFLFMLVSALANTAHASEFASPLRIYDVFTFLNEKVYLIAFGSMLPVASFLYASTLANETVHEEEFDEEFENLQKELREARTELKTFEALKPIMSKTAKNEDKITALDNFFRKQGMEIPQNVIAQIVQVSPSYVSNVLKGNRAEE